MAWVLLVSACFLPVLVAVYIAWPTWKLRKIPGAPCLWGIGHLPLLEKYQQDAFVKLAQEYGPIYRFQMGRQPIVFVASAELCQEVGLKKFKSAANRSVPPYLKENNILLDGVAFTRDARWASTRNLLKSIFQPDRLADYVPIIREGTLRLMDILDDNADAKVDVNISKLLLDFAMKVLIETLFGTKVSLLEGQSSHSESEETAFVEAANASVRALKVENAAISVMFGIFFPVLQHPVNQIMKRIPGTADWQEHHSNETVLKMAKKLIHKRQQELENDVVRQDVVSSMLKARKESKEMHELLTNETIANVVYDLLLAGSDTTANSLGTVLYYVSSHPEVEKKLLQEIDEYAPIGKSEPSLQALEGLAYLDQVIKESLRMCMAAPVVARETSEEIELGGYHIPKGTWLWMAYIAVSEDAANFPEPHTFRPERFNPDCEENKRRHPFAQLAFGLGPRMCPGYKFAKLEMKLALVHLYQRFTFEHSPLMEKPLALHFGVTVAPKYGIRLRVHKRQ